MGISMLIIGSFIPWIYYGFYCRREPKITYIAMVCVLGAGNHFLHEVESIQVQSLFHYGTNSVNLDIGLFEQVSLWAWDVAVNFSFSIGNIHV